MTIRTIKKEITLSEYYLTAEAIKGSIDKFYYIVYAQDQTEAIKIAKKVTRNIQFRVKNVKVIQNITEKLSKTIDAKSYEVTDSCKVYIQLEKI